MYCPRCGGEFREGIERCSDCGVDLLAGELPPSSELRRARGLFAHLTRPEEEIAERGDVVERGDGVEEGDDPYALLGHRSVGDAGAAAARGVPTPLDRRRFRVLVLGYVAATVGSWLYVPPWTRDIPADLYIELESYFGANPLSRTLDAFYWLTLPAAVVLAVGLLGFSRPARHLFVALWVWLLLQSLLGGPGFGGGLVSTLGLVADLLGGAVLALAFFGPVASAFEAAPAARRRIAARSAPPPEAAATSPE